jgi:hypothetical protein
VTRPQGVGPLLGPVATALAEHSHCPVAIIRTNAYEPPADRGVIAVVLDDEPDNDEVVHQAMKEARLRKASVRQIDRRVNSWVRRYPDVQVQTVAAGTGSRYPENRSSTIELAVVGRADGNKISQLAIRTPIPFWATPTARSLWSADSGSPAVKPNASPARDLLLYIAPAAPP